MNKEFATQKYNATTLLFVFLLTMMLIILLLIVVGKVIGSVQFAIAGYVCLCTLPFLFEKRIKALFTQKAAVRFNNSGMSVVCYTRDDERVSNEVQIGWDEIQSYRFYFTPKKNTVLSLWQRDGSRKRWNFKENKTTDESIGGDSIFNAFRAGVNQFNSGKEEDERIELIPGFWNSKAGTAILYAELAALAIGFVIHLTTHPQSSVFTLLTGLSVVAGLFIRRKQEKELFERISGL